MNRFFLICGIVAGLLLNAVATAERTVEPVAQEIPLDQVWGYNLSGTKDVLKLDAVKKDDIFVHPIVQPILDALSGKFRRRGNAGNGFVVTGSGEEALKNAEAVLSHKSERQEIFADNTELTLVFYSLAFPRSIRIESIEKRSDSITVRYRFVTHLDVESTRHFALIPLGKSLNGSVQVVMEQLPDVSETSQPPTSLTDPKGIVCNSFTFDVAN